MNFTIAYPFLRRVIPIAALLCLMLPLRAADDEEGGRKCSNATLKGDYGLLASGIRGVGPGVTEMFVLTGLRTYDGNGGFTTISNAHGLTSGVSRDVKATGTYQVNADCTGTATIVITGVPEPLVSSFVIVDRAREVKEVTLTPASSIGTAILRRK
jgi:hypothetical protein